MRCRSLGRSLADSCRSAANGDARLADIFSESGTYSVRVTGTSYDGQPMQSWSYQSYTLNVSLENADVAAPVIVETGSATIASVTVRLAARGTAAQATIG